MKINVNTAIRINSHPILKGFFSVQQSETFQDVVPETFNLIEVLLDKGVNEQVLPSDARPWQILQKSRKVRF